MGTTGRKRTTMLKITTALLTAAVAALTLAGTASAKQIQQYKFEGFFDGTGSTAGVFTGNLSRVALNDSNGRVYVMDAHGGIADISQFNAAGVAQNWSGLGGVSTLSLGESLSGVDMVFDNYGHNGGLHARTGFGKTAIRAFREDGTLRLPGFGEGAGCGMGVAPDGFLWTATGQWAFKMDNETGFLADGQSFLTEQQPCHLAIDSQGYFWVQKTSSEFGLVPGLYKYGRESEFGNPNGGFNQSPVL